MVREATENGVYNVEVNSSEAHVGSSSGAIGCVEQPEQSLSGSLLQPYSPNVLQSTVSLQPSSVVAVMATSCPPVHSVIGSTLSDSATGLEGCSEQEKFLCGEKSSTPSATRPCVATEASTELTDGMPITEAADSGSEREDLHNTPEQSSVCESCSLLGKAVPAFGIHALDTSSTTEELRSPPENNMFAQESSEKRKFLQLGISAILKKATRSVESSSVHSGWSSSSTGVGQDDTSAMTHDIQSVSDAHLVRSEQSDGAVSDYSHHSALLSSCELHLVPYVPHDLRSATEGGVQGATQWVEPSGSSLVFVPRGLSGGPRAPSNLPLPPGNPDEDISVNTTGNDLAPDMEMDLYGISYSLDSLDH